MILGDSQVFGLELRVSELFERASFVALGCYRVHVDGVAFGVDDDEASLLACSYQSLDARLRCRGRHVFEPAREYSGAEIAAAYTDAVYSDRDPDDVELGLPLRALGPTFHERRLVLAPDGDQVFDDSSRILHFDLEERVRLVAYRSVSCNSADGTRDLVDVELDAELFYGTLDQWLQHLRALREKEWPGAGWPTLDVD